MKRTAYLILALILAGTASLLASTSEPAGKISLWKSGVALRGANLWQRRVYPELDGEEFLGPGPFGPPVTMEDFSGLAAHGANWVQLSHPGIYAEEPPYGPDWRAVENLDRLVDMAEQAGLYVTITFRTGPGRSEFSILRDGAGDWFDPSYLNEKVWTEPLAREAWAAMWKFAAGRYRGRRAVIGYDLMCEPNASDIVREWEPEEFHALYGGTGFDWNSWYPQLALAIREVDQETPILVQPDGYGSPYWAPYLAKAPVAGCVLAMHPYDPHAYTHQDESDARRKKRVYPGRFDADEDGKADQVDASWLTQLLGQADAAAKKLGMAACANEYGLMRWEPGASAYIADIHRCFEALGWNHAVWEWKPAWKGFDEVNAFDFRREPGLDRVMRENWATNAYRP